MTENSVETTNALLRVVIALLLRTKDAELITLRDKVEFLSGTGLGPTEISKIINRTTGYVTKELAGIRKGRR